MHLRCDYGPAGSQVFTDVGPLLEALAVGLAVVLAVGIVGWCARVLTVAVSPGVRKS